MFGGMAGCAMIGQSVINVRSGGRGRLSTLVAGVFLLILVVGLGPWVARIPMPALVAVMFMVSVDAVSIDAACPKVVLDFSKSHIWDDSAVGAIDKVVLRLRALGVDVELVGLNEASASLVSRLAVHDKSHALSSAPGH
jgi:MFS superfamily sulfate permease-like transporter